MVMSSRIPLPHSPYTVHGCLRSLQSLPCARRWLLDDFDGPEVFFELAGLGSTEKYGGDIWILHTTREQAG